MATAKRLSGSTSPIQRKRNLKQRIWSAGAKSIRRGTKKKG